MTEALSSPPFREAMPEPAGEGALQALADLPAAAAVQRLAHRLLSAGLHLDAESAVEAAVKRTYDLYEAVIFYRLADALQSVLGDGWTAQWADGTGTAHEEKPEAAVVWRQTDGTGGTVRLLYQQTFRALSPKNGEWHSLSGEFRPDYVISVEQDGACAGWLILDAKYRSARPSIHDGLRDVHVYRDALRRHGRKADAAFIIVPALDDGAAAYADPTYRAEHAFGAIVSAQDGGGLAAMLRPFFCVADHKRCFHTGLVSGGAGVASSHPR